MSDERTSETDWARIDAMTDDEIDTSDSPPFDDRLLDYVQVRTPDGQGTFIVPAEDAWAYTPEHRAAVERARNSPTISGVTEEDLLALIEADDPQAAIRELIDRRSKTEHPAG